MNSLVFAVLDVKAKAYMQPFFSPNRATAVRALAVAMRDAGSLIGKHPEDFALFEIGSFEDGSGVLTGAPGPSHVCTAVSLTGDSR
jgi:hypothetical protein